MIGLVGADRVMLGSDYPYDMAMMDCVAHVRSLKISDADKDADSRRPRRKTAGGESAMNVQATPRPRAFRSTPSPGYHRRHGEIRRARRRCRQGRRADAGGRSRRRRRARRVPPAAICRAAEARLDQSRGRTSRSTRTRAGDRAGRRRQRHGPSGRGARDGNRNRACARERRCLGRHAHVEPRRRRRRLCRAAAEGRHDRHLCRGRQRQPHAARRRRRAAARHQSAGDRHSGRRGAAAGARYRDLDRLLRHHQEPPPAQQAAAADWMVDPKTGEAVTDPQKTSKRCCCRWPATRAPGSR